MDNIRQNTYSAKDIVTLSPGRAFREKIGYPDYLIYNDGKIYSKKTNKFLTPFKKSTGYYAVNLYNFNGEPKMFLFIVWLQKLFWKTQIIIIILIIKMRIKAIIL